MPRNRTIKFDHELTPYALQLVADVEARQERAAAKARRIAELKEAGRRVALKKPNPEQE